MLEIARIEVLAEENPLGVQVRGVELVIVADGGEVRVFEGRCPHQGTLLAEGHLEDGRLVCRGHGWQFDSESGCRAGDARTCLRSFVTEVADGRVLVDADEVADWEAAQRAGEAQGLLAVEDLPGPKGLPGLGNIHQMRVETFHLSLEAWYREFGDLYQFKLGPERAVVVADPVMVQQILQKRPDGFSRLADIRSAIEEMGVEGLFSAEGEQWRRHRYFAMRAFDVRHLRDFFPTMQRVTERLHSRWARLSAGPEPVDVQEELMRYTVDITTNLAFGYDMNTLEEEGDRIQQHLERIFPMIAFRAFMPVKYWRYFKLPADRALEKSLEEVKGSITTFIAHARAEMAADPELRERPRNLLQALLAAQEAAQEAEEIAFSDREVYGNVFTFLLAGEDTTANTMAWMMYFMVKHPEVQQRMQAEAAAVLGDDLVVASYEQADRLRYIEAVTHETMRLKPVASFMGMRALEDVTIGRLRIPAGMSTMVLMRPKGLEDSEFEDAAEFRPARWLDYDRAENPHHKKAFMPFGGGPRLCPGRSLALLEIKMAMATLCRDFEVVRAVPDEAVAERFVFTIMPEGLKVGVRPRPRA